MSQVTAQMLTDAALDCDTIAAVANSTDETVTDREGNTKLTLQGAINRLGYQPPVAYTTGLSMTASSQTVEYSGGIYAPKPADLPFTTSGTFESAKFRLINASTATLPDGSVSTIKIVDYAVTVDKLANTLDLSGKTLTLPAGVVTASNLAAGAAATNLGTGNVTAAMLAATLDLSGKTLTLSAAQRASDYLEYRDEKAAGTSGGNAVSGSWATRTLNTEHADNGNHGTLSSNQITLAAGTYEAEIHVPAYAVGRHQARLQNVTDGTTTLVGRSATNESGATVANDSIITGRFTIASPKAFEVQHRVASSQTNGLGTAANFGVTEIYTVARFRKVG